MLTKEATNTHPLRVIPSRQIRSRNPKRENTRENERKFELKLNPALNSLTLKICYENCPISQENCNCILSYNVRFLFFCYLIISFIWLCFFRKLNNKNFNLNNYQISSFFNCLHTWSDNYFFYSNNHLTLRLLFNLTRRTPFSDLEARILYARELFVYSLPIFFKLFTRHIRRSSCESIF